MKEGSLSALVPGGWNIVLGRELATQLGAGVGDDVNVFVSEATVTPIGPVPRARRFHVVGIFEVGAQEYDFGLAVVHMQRRAEAAAPGPGRHRRAPEADRHLGRLERRAQPGRPHGRASTACTTGRATTPTSSAR
jgi:hypothetical protein